MKPRVHHFNKQTEDVRIIKSIRFGIVSPDLGQSAGFSNIIRDFLESIKNNKPLKPRHYVHEEYPCILKGEPDNFSTTETEFGTIRLIQAAQDEEELFYLRFETENGFYYTLIP